jgi:hypothetical protein
VTIQRRNLVSKLYLSSRVYRLGEALCCVASGQECLDARDGREQGLNRTVFPLSL